MKISVCSHPCFGEREQFAVLKECGFDGCDLSLDPYFERNGMFADMNALTDRQIEEYFTALRQKAKQAGFEICQVHAAFSGHPRDYGFSKEEILQRTIASIKAAHYLGTRLCVIHPIITPGRRYDLKMREAFDESVAFYRALIPTLEAYDVYACIENMWLVDPVYGHICSTILSHAQEMVDMCKLLGERFKICLDVGHGLLTQDDPVEMVKICGPYLGCLHVHDNDGISDLHTFPFSVYEVPYSTAWKPQKTDWPAFMQALGEVGYTGPFSFEIKMKCPMPLCPAALTYLSAIGKYLVSLVNDKGE